jgi:thiamine-phosphate pyrophosphorylase
LILDAQVADYDRLFYVAKKAISGGVDIVQLRDKTGDAADIIRVSEKIIRFTKHRVPYIINDRIDIAQVVECDGVHIGQKDIPLEKVRKLLGRKKLIGMSCQTLKHCQKAQKEGADYIGFGSVFKTLTKPERQPMDLKLLSKVLKKIEIPIFPIGGIDRTNIALLKDLGVGRVAVCRSICGAKEPQAAAAFFKKALQLSKTSA